MKKDIILLELFSGIGGFAKGFQDAGYNIKKHYFSEIDKHAIANYKYNFKDAEFIGSVTNVRNIIRTINKARKSTDKFVITFGSPCQDFSLAGKRLGMAGERSSLITFAIFLIKWLRPDVYIWENVKGAYSSNAGADYWAIIQAFANLNDYRFEQQLLNTSWVLPQNRERIYLIGHLAGRSEPGVFPFTENGGLSNKPQDTKNGRPQTKNSSTIGAGSLRADDTYIELPKKAACLTGGGHSGGLHSDMTVVSVATPGRKVKNQNGSRFKENDSFCLTAEPHGVMIKTNTKTVFEIGTQCDQAVIKVKQINDFKNYGNSTKQQERVYDTSGLMCCISSSRTDSKLNIVSQNDESQIRRLTEIECERLQGFPDDWTKFGNYDGQIKQIAKTRRYKMCGNAVTATLVKAIAERLKII